MLNAKDTPQFGSPGGGAIFHFSVIPNGPLGSQRHRHPSTPFGGGAALFFSWSFLRLFLYFSYTFLLLLKKRQEKEKKRKRKGKTRKDQEKTKKRQEKTRKAGDHFLCKKFQNNGVYLVLTQNIKFGRQKFWDKNLPWPCQIKILGTKIFHMSNIKWGAWRGSHGRYHVL